MYRFLIFFSLIFISFTSNGQISSVIVNLESVKSFEKNEFDILNFQLLNTGMNTRRVVVKGELRVSGTTESIVFEKELLLNTGLLNFGDIRHQISLTYSSNSLKNLYLSTKMLPLGRIKYCVSVFEKQNSGENTGLVSLNSECILINNNDAFIIELIEPKDKAIISEFNPLLSWIVNSAVTGSLKYRLMVANMQKGQSTADAIKRNALIFDDKAITSLSITYPLYARKLELNKKYAWNVEAYCYGFLIGTAKPWSFELKSEPEKDSIDYHLSYFDILADISSSEIIVPGQLKLKYHLTESFNDSLTYTLQDIKGKDIKLKFDIRRNMKYGDNRFVIDFNEEQPLKHNKKYILHISGHHFKNRKIVFTYKNPNY